MWPPHFKADQKLYTVLCLLKPTAVLSIIKWTAEKKILTTQQNQPFATDCAAPLEPMATESDIAAAQHRDVPVQRNNNCKEKSRETSWLYQCMISDCSCTFERLADLRVHFVDNHQSGNHASCLIFMIITGIVS